MNRYQLRKQRQIKMKYKIRGSEDRPRLTVFKSNDHIYAQIIDDKKGVTLASGSDLGIKEKGLKAVEIAEKVGEEIGKKAKDKKITKVVLDRSGYKYHGRVKALAEGARKAGLSF
jgi:large subunit ribosomal protein L18